MKSQVPELSIIIVNYNGKSVLDNCVKSVLKETKEVDFEIFVVDNNSNDGSPEALKQNFPEVTFIRKATNVGFAKANNEAIFKSHGKYIMLLNPDTVVLDRAIEKMVAFLENRPQASAVGCKLLNDDRTLQHSIGSFPGWINQISRLLYLHRLLPGVAAVQEIVTATSRYGTAHPVDWLFGAAILIRKDILNEIGLLDDRFFLFSEEKDWCYRLKKAGKYIYYYPDAEIVHYGRGQATNPKVFALLALSKLKFMKKHYSAITFRAFHALSILSMLINTLVWGALMLTLFRNKSSASQKFALYSRAFLRLLRSKAALSEG